MYKTIKVKRKHIRNGNPAAVCTCPIALAIKEQFEDIDIVKVGTISAQIKYKTFPFDWEVLDFPKEAIDFIQRFDKKLPVEPFKFKVFK